MRFIDRFHARLHQNIDVGLVIIDLEMNVKVWNGFMENHSGLLSHDVNNKKLADIFDEISEQWLMQKINTVYLHYMGTTPLFTEIQKLSPYHR